MGVFNNWPYTDVHQLNLDFILDTMKDVKGKTDQIDSAVETATTAAENAAESEQNAKASEDNAVNAATSAADVYQNIQEYTQNLQNQVTTNTADIAVNTGRIDEIISGASVDPDAELIDIRVAADGVTYPTAGDAVRGQYNILKTADGYYYDFPAPAWLFYASKSYNFNTNTYGNTSTQSTSLPIKLTHPFIVKSYDPDTSIRTKFNDTLINWNKEMLIPANIEVILNFGFPETCTRAQFDNVHFIMSAECYAEFLSKYTLKVTERVSTYISDTNSYFTRAYGINTVGDNIGLLSYGTKQYATSVYPILSDSDIVVYRYTGNTYEMLALNIANNNVETINNAAEYIINAGSMITLTGSYYTDSGNIIMPVVILTDPSYLIRLSARYNINTRVDVAFQDNNKHVWCLGRTDYIYYVFEDQILIHTGTVTPGFGHGNTCQYLNGKLYITDGSETLYNIIHVYNVDETAYTLSFAYDITVPVDTTMGGGVYLLNKNENLIHAINFNSGHLTYRLLYKTDNNYYVSFSRDIARPSRYMQGACIKDNAIYYLDNNDNYHHEAVIKYDLATGIAEPLFIASTASTIETAETEAIFPVLGIDAFKIVAVNGLAFTLCKY